MQDGTQFDAMNPWGVELFRTLRTVSPDGSAQETAYGDFLDQRFERESARNARIHGAVGVIPTPLWLVLFLIAALIFIFMLFFADSGEPALVQATLMGTVIAAITAILLVIGFLDKPFSKGVGSLQPVAMERALRVLERDRQELGVAGALPCDEKGLPVRRS